MLKKFFLFLFIFSSFFVNVSADIKNDTEDMIKELESFSSDFSFYELYESFSSGEKLPSGTGLLSDFVNIFTKELKLTFRSLCFLLVPVFLFGILRFISEEKEGSVSSVAFIGCFAFLCAVVTGVFREMTALVSETALSIDIMTKGLVPIFFTILGTMGNITQTTLVQPFVLTVTQVMSELLKNLILPAVYTGFALSLTESITGMKGLGYFGALIFKILKWVLVFLVVFFLAFLSAQSLTGNALDSMAVKSTKFAVSNFIPVVGGAMADGVETLGLSMKNIKNATGIAGIFAIIYICVIPLVKIYAVSLMFHIMAALSFPVSDKRFGDILSCAGSSMSILGGIILCMAFIFIVTAAVVIATNPILSV